MANLKQVAQDMLPVAREGIGWIALWKGGRDGRSWNYDSFYPDFDDEMYSSRIEAFELDRLHLITEIDPNAVFLNGWYHNLGDPDEMTRDSLAKFLRWQYDLGTYTLTEALESMTAYGEEDEQ